MPMSHVEQRVLHRGGSFNLAGDNFHEGSLR